MKPNLLFIVFLFFSLTLNAQEDWSELYEKNNYFHTNDSLGFSVAIFQNWTLAGAPGNNNSSGYVRIYEVTNDVWDEYQDITPASLHEGDRFGAAIAINDTYIIIGAPEDDYDTDNDNELSNAGSVYIFKYNSTSEEWEEFQKITASTRHANAHFGTSVEISGTNMVVGAPGEAYDDSEANELTDAGAAYFFRFNGTEWIQRKKVVASDRASGDKFGFSVSIAGNQAVIGAPYHDYDDGSTIETDAGAAYIFKNSFSTSWTQQRKIVSSIYDDDDLYGYAVSMCENNMLIGDPGYQNDKGAAEYFYYSSSWSLKNVYTDPDTNNSDKFGYALVADTNLFAISSTNWTGSENGKIGSGVTFVYSVTSGNATYIDRATPIEFTDDSHFITHIYVGRSVDLYGDYIVAGAPREATGYSYNYCGGIYIYSNKPHFTLQPRPVYNVCNDDNTYFVIEGENYDSIRWQVSKDYQKTFQDIYDNNIYMYPDAEEFYILGNETPQLTDITKYYYRCKLMGQYGTTYSEPVRIVTSFIMPLLYVSDTTIYLDANGQFTINSSFVVDSVDKNNGCNILDTILSKSVFSCSDIGSQTIDVTVENVNHNTKTETVTVTVLDTISPVIEAHDTLVYSDSSCEASLPDFTTWFTVSDNCSILSTTQLPAAGTVISSDQTVSLSAQDSSGNMTTVSFYISVADTINPEITSTHNDVSIDADENCEATLPDYTSTVVATDNCDTDLDVSQSPPAGTVFSGFKTVILTVTDDYGNTDEVEFRARSKDVTPPTIVSVHNDTTLFVDSDCKILLPDFTDDVKATDNCSRSKGLGLIIVSQTPAVGTSYTTGDVVEVTLTATDDAHNSSQVKFNVTVSDNTDPVITSTHDDQTVSGDENCQYTLPDYTGTVTVTDNCDTSLSITQLPAPGTVFTGYADVTLTATDDYGNSDEVSFHVVITDTEDPQVTTKDFTVYLDENGEAVLSGEDVIERATDNCSLADTVLTRSDFDCADIGSPVNIDVTVKDAAGNSATGTVQVTVLDSLTPVINCISDQEITLSGDETSYVVSGTEFDLTDKTDNCEIETVINDYNNEASLSGASFPEGTTTVKWTVTDKSGNSSECSFDVIVNKTTTAISSIDDNGEILIYPNPVADKIVVIVPFSEKYLLQVTDISGRVVKEVKANSRQITVDLSSQDSGVYYLKFLFDKEQITRSVIKQ